MRPKEQRKTGQGDIFKSRLDQIVDMKHPLAVLGAKVDWGFLETSFGAVYTDRPGRPPLPTRLMAGLAILNSMHNLSDGALCDRRVENPYYQIFCGEEFFSKRGVLPSYPHCQRSVRRRRLPNVVGQGCAYAAEYTQRNEGSEAR